MTVKTFEGANKRLKQITATAEILTHAIGVMEVDGWFGRGETTKGLSECTATFKSFGSNDTWQDITCFDGGAVCAGIAIDVAAQRYAKARRWNKQRTYKLAENSLDQFLLLNGRAPTQSLFRGIASWNDHEVQSYEDMKAAFGVALQALTREKAEILANWPRSGGWNLSTVS